MRLATIGRLLLTGIFTLYLCLFRTRHGWLFQIRTGRSAILTDSISIGFPAFSPVLLNQREQVEKIRAISGSTLYLYTFPTLFAWQADEQYEICLLNDAFLVKNGARGACAYLFPCGTDAGKKSLTDALLKREKPVFYFVRDEDRRFLEKEYPGRFVFTSCRDDYPYLYDKDAQIALSGKGYKKLRHQINLGRSAAGEWTLEPMTEENVGRALSLNRQWADARGVGSVADSAAAETALRHFRELSLWGMLFRADGIDVAYVVGSFVTPEIFDISFCKVLDARCDCYIKWALYSALPDIVKTVDSEEDMGIPGLRTHKLLRQPKELTRVWKGSLRA